MGLTGYSPMQSEVKAVIDGIDVYFSNKIIIHLYEVIRFDYNRRNNSCSFEDYCNSLFDKKVDKKDE